MSEPHCGDCKHWHKTPLDPNNLGQPPKGQCRGAPPGLFVVPAGAGQLTMVSAYPTLDAGFAACAAFERREATT